MSSRVLPLMVLAVFGVFVFGFVSSLIPQGGEASIAQQSTSAPATSAQLTRSPAASATLLPTSTSSPPPTVDELATTQAQSQATLSSSSTGRALTQTAIARATDDALELRAFEALAREQSDAHAIAIAQVAELEARRQIWLLTVEPTAVSIQKTEDIRQLWRQVERDRVEDEAHATLVAQQLEDDKQISTAYKIGQISLVGGLPIAIVISLVLLAHAQSQKIRADRDTALAEIESKNYERASKNYEAQLEHDLQMSRAEILNRRDLINVVSKRSVSTIDGRMTRERLIAFVKAAVLASGPASTVLTPSTDRVWNDDDVRISHREYSACAEELHRLQWIEKPERGKLTNLTEGATLGDLLSVLQRSNRDDASAIAPPDTIEEELITQS